jgi:acetylornithine/succinyldiaminopimelate/putrescine aminotransferase
VLRFAPPLLIRPEEVEEALGILRQVMEPFAEAAT